MRKKYDRLTTTIERQWLAEIIRTKRFKNITWPFELRLINGMNPPMPEVTVLIHKITKNHQYRAYELHIKKVLGFEHWDKRRQAPKR